MFIYDTLDRKVKELVDTDDETLSKKELKYLTKLHKKAMKIKEKEYKKRLKLNRCKKGL